MISDQRLSDHIKMWDSFHYLSSFTRDCIGDEGWMEEMKPQNRKQKGCIYKSFMYIEWQPFLWKFLKLKLFAKL